MRASNVPQTLKKEPNTNVGLEKISRICLSSNKNLNSIPGFETYMSNGLTCDLHLLNACYIRVPSLNNSRAFITNFSNIQIDHEQQSKATNHTIET